MLDISNKLHAMVDEFVSSLKSECDTLVHNVPAQDHNNVPNDSRLAAPRAARPSNRTTLEVLKGLRRPSESHVMDYPNGEGKSHMEHGESNTVEGSKKYRDNGRSSRHLSEMRSKSASLEGVDHNPNIKSVDILSNNIEPKAKVKRGRPTQGTAPKGNSHTL